MATLKDVAKDAGVSIATVSCCLSGSRQVSPKTKARVMDSIEKLKYIPNSAARNLKGASTNKIGIILTDIDNTYHSEIFKGVSAYFQLHNYTLNVAFSNGSPDVERERILDFVSQNVSGLLIITSQPQNEDFFTSHIRNFGIPTVFVERRPHNIGANFVGFDDYSICYYLTSQLLTHHYRRIALITGSLQYSSEADSAKGFRDAFSANKVPLSEHQIQETNMSKEDAFKTVLTSLDLDTLEAIITTSENMAYGVLEALRLQNLKVPEDIQLITYSEESWNDSARAGGIIHTSRTAFTLGRSAAELLLQNIKSPVLFEERSILFTDEIVHTPLSLEPPAKKIPFALPAKQTAEPLRILMGDLSTSHAAKLLSATFTMQTGIPVEIGFTSHTELLDEIIKDIELGRHHYDIYMYDVPWLEYMAQNFLVTDITDFVNGDSFDKSALFKQNMDNCRYEDKYYGIPIIGGSQILFYRKDLFENKEVIKSFKNKYKISLRPPRTWTEFNGIAEFFTREYNPDSPTLYGTSLAGIVDEELAPEILIRLWANGGAFWDKYSRSSLNTPENARAYASILQTLNYAKKDPFSTSIIQTVEDFSSGKTAMLITYTEYAAQISHAINSRIIGRVGYESLPGRTPVSIGWNLGMNPFTNKTEAVYQYFNWLCQRDTSFYMTIVDGQSPVIAPYHSHELLKLYPWMELTEKSFEFCRKRNGPRRRQSLIIPQNKIEAILCRVLRDIIKNGLSIQDALEKGQADMEALFKSYGYPKPLHFIQDM